MSESAIEIIFYVMMGSLVLIFLYQLYNVTIAKLPSLVKWSMLGAVIIGVLERKGIIKNIYEFVENLSFEGGSMDMSLLALQGVLGFFAFVFFMNIASFIKK